MDTENEESLLQFFGSFRDKITDIVINKNKKSFEYSPKNNATLYFKDSFSASDAIRKLNLRKINGKTVRVMWHDADNSSRYNSHNNLFVKNIPEKVTPREFYEYFSQFGDILSAKLNEDENGKSFGYGYINYQDQDSAAKAFDSSNGKVIWGENKQIEVKNFLKKNERINEGNKNIYIKNIPNDFTDKDIHNLFDKYGVITWAKVITDNSTNRKFAIVNFEHDESVQVAIDNTNGIKIGEYQLFVSVLMRKNERVKYLNQNYSNMKFCNLHIRNIPYNVKETELHQNFEQFGEIKSVRIAKKFKQIDQGGNLKTIEIPDGFGYVCYFNQESAKAAIEKMNGSYLKKYEGWKYPLIVDYFMPKKERVLFLNRVKQSSQMGFPTNPNMLAQPGFGGFMPRMPMGNFPSFNFPTQGPPMMFPGMIQTIGAGGPRPNLTNQRPFVQTPKGNNVPLQSPKNEEVPDLKYLDSLEGNDAKKDYLGEFIFKQVENHSTTTVQNLTIDAIGKITGMILGIDDIKDIFEIAKNRNLLNERMKEAIELLQNSDDK
jgi:polyadenylate-binding protein